MSTMAAALAGAGRSLRHRPGAAIGGAILVLLVLAGLLAPLLAPFPEDAGTATDLMSTLLPPDALHPLGTDQAGRDVWSRVLFGIRISLGAAVAIIACALCIGVPVGLLAGTAGGIVDAVLMRIVDVFLAFPSLLLALAIGAALGPSLENAALAIVLAWWPWYARLMRGEAVAVRRRAYVTSARLLGYGTTVTALRHVLPNAVGPVIVQASLDLGGVILTLAALSFLGLGARDPLPEWGLMVEQGRVYIVTQPWLSVAPGIAIMLAAFAFTLLGEGLRERLDPRGSVRR